METIYSDLEILEYPLPEDIQRMKEHGDFAVLNDVIDRRIKMDIPAALKKRLELEKKILLRIPRYYPYSWDEAVKTLSENFRDFNEAELRVLWEENAVDWIYIEGKIHFHRALMENLMNTRPAFRERNIHEPKKPAANPVFELRSKTAKQMKKSGSLNYFFHIRSAIKINESSEKIGEKIQIHLPIPIEYAQVRNFRLLSTSMAPAHIAPPDYPQRTVCFETTLKKNQAFSVEYQFETHMTYHEPDPEKATDAQPTFFTQEYPPHIRFTPYLRSLTKEILGGEQNPLRKVRMIYDYLTSHMKYSFVRSYSTIEDIPAYAATGFKGDCGVQALLFITLCRIAGIPARWQSGLSATPLYVGDHDWAQFFIAPYGWLFADCSYGGSAKRNGDEELWNFYFGNLDPFRIPFCSEFQHDFAVPTKHFRNDPYDNQDGEAAYEDRSLLSCEFETEHTALEISMLGA